ncbi:ARABIDOPSIS THALIANA MYOSIN 1, myosin 2, ARABIDOPSIS THALIANA MYOSIN 4 [Hibiscus trionum]|uniref:ARABIDOPSIS THALIANA MYOSIN 1, myosin 2, ARABIDOPSIS THALIANA MYOSIN 4 n=1 Tax=Hibiscus trionum TaxID=183268 RepID=A0A9W7MTZ5_HIBTR|nr:ARABIDOPSIS THALIANA MYOSIN 1, myosin 2, ARABIDOPSIS THALIANA MYOSIN 4 [Hibiscus trionum]
MFSFARNSLEEMLESLRQRDDGEKPKDVPPALPSRPPSRARVISGRWAAQPTFNADGENGGVDDKVKRNTLWGNKMRKDVNVDSPYNLEEEKKVLEGSDNIGYFIEKKLHVWCRQSRGVWAFGTIEATSGEESFVSLANENVVKVSTSHLFPANPEILDGVDDLMHLSYLNEPSVLHNLKYRYSCDMIYSKAGAVLIAVNPFKDVEIYGKDFVTAYKQKSTDSPHVFDIAATAYNDMMNDGVSQSLIISGEYGAGKTETAKFAMKYLTAVGGGKVEIEGQLLYASCILEAFGNAKTSRNDNASRFGELVEIHFTEVGEISGVKIETCKHTRVVELDPAERSYHIFYQLCAGAPQTLRERLFLKKADEYNYLAQSDCLVINDVDDSEEFHKLMEALDIVQISNEDKDQVFKMLSAVLWLGNISFQVIDNENHVEASNDEALISAARLLGCASHDLNQALCAHTIHADKGSDKGSIVKKFTLQQASDARDALAKWIYAYLFDWLVEKINKLLDVGKQHDGRSISILDIYGFESCKKNSFEQLCINYANERLQQHFNRHLLKLEQEEYELDGIDGVKVDFVDNQECLDLFEKKSIGLLSLLDEESNSPDANDSTFVSKLKQHLSGNSCFKGDKSRAFGVRHFAGEVLYDTNGFLKKNQDTLNTELIELLSSCESQFPQTFAIKMLNQSLNPDVPKQGVGIQLKGQLFKLMHQLENTKPHFICCIKPNRKQLPSMYDDDLVLQQLRCCGVFEVVRISRYGYPARMTHQKFAERYGSLLLETNVSQDPLSISVAVLKQFNVLPEMYQIGYTKLYLRTGQIGALEDWRKQVGAVEDRRKKPFPSVADGEIQGKYTNEDASSYLASDSQLLDEQLTAIIVLQSVIRGCLVQKHLGNLHALRRLRSRRTMSRKYSKDIPNEQPSAMAELQKRVLDVEATLGQKEQENATLREQVQQYEENVQKEQENASLREQVQQYEANMQKEQENAALWEQVQQYEANMRKEQENATLRDQQYEAKMQKEQEKMKKMEETLQKQIASLQASLAAAKKSDGSDGQLGRGELDSKDNVSMQPRTLGGNKTDVGGKENGVSGLAKEFEQQKQSFEDDMSKMDPNSSSYEELRNLKRSFRAWKKDYKTRLREMKAKFPKKQGHKESDKTRKTWWPKRGKVLQMQTCTKPTGHKGS